MEPLESTISDQIGKYPKLVILGLSESTENAKMGSLITEHQEHDPGTHTKSFKLMWLTLGEQGY